LRRRLFSASFTLAVAVGCAGLRAEPIAVRRTEGVVHGFLVLRTLEGKTLADGELIQFAQGDLVTSRLLSAFVTVRSTMRPPEPRADPEARRQGRGGVRVRFPRGSSFQYHALFPTPTPCLPPSSVKYSRRHPSGHREERTPGNQVGNERLSLEWTPRSGESRAISRLHRPKNVDSCHQRFRVFTGFLDLSRGRRSSHNPKVAGSNPAPATKIPKGVRRRRPTPFFSSRAIRKRASLLAADRFSAVCAYQRPQGGQSPSHPLGQHPTRLFAGGSVKTRISSSLEDPRGVPYLFLWRERVVGSDSTLAPQLALAVARGERGATVRGLGRDVRD
jgi:hypothetical protein